MGKVDQVAEAFGQYLVSSIRLTLVLGRSLVMRGWKICESVDSSVAILLGKMFSAKLICLEICSFVVRDTGVWAKGEAPGVSHYSLSLLSGRRLIGVIMKMLLAGALIFFSRFLWGTWI